MSDNLTTPATGATLATKDNGGVHFPWNLLADATGADAMGAVGPTPDANTLLGRLKSILDAITTMDGHVDGLEGLATVLNGLVDGLEAAATTQSTAALQAAGNATLTAISGYLDNVEALLGAATPAGENYIGKTGGDVLSATSGAITGTTAIYVTGQVIGGKLTFNGATRLAAGSGIVQAASIFSKAAQSTAVDLVLFAADPAASTLTDHNSPVIHANDIDKILGVIHLTDWSGLGTPALAQNLAVGLPFKLATATALYGVLIARGSITLASATDLAATLRILPG